MLQLQLTSSTLYMYLKQNAHTCLPGLFFFPSHIALYFRQRYEGGGKREISPSQFKPHKLLLTARCVGVHLLKYLSLPFKYIH